LGEQEKSESLENLRRELEAYKNNKPWRELLSEDLAGPEGEMTPKGGQSDALQPPEESEKKSDEESEKKSDEQADDSDSKDSTPQPTEPSDDDGT
jgi:hypothetical protein